MEDDEREFDAGLAKARQHDSITIRNRNLENNLLEASATGGESSPLFTGRDRVSPYKHDGNGSLLEWSWNESTLCWEMNGENSLAIICMSPCLSMTFSVTLLGKLVHDFYEQGTPLSPSETPHERRVRIQGILTTTGLMIIICVISVVILLRRRYLQSKSEAAFDDLVTVYLRSLITFATSVNVIISNIIFLNSMRQRWQQPINVFIVGSYAIVISQLMVGSFDSWILLTGDYTISDVIFCFLHLSETLYSAVQCFLYSTMWNVYIREKRSASISEGEHVATINTAMLTIVNFLSLLISFRFTSVSDYAARHSTN